MVNVSALAVQLDVSEHLVRLIVDDDTRQRVDVSDHRVRQVQSKPALAGVAVDHPRESLVVLPCGHLFGRNTTRLAVKQGAYLRGFVYDFIELLAPAWSKAKLTDVFM